MTAAAIPRALWPIGSSISQPLRLWCLSPLGRALRWLDRTRVSRGQGAARSKLSTTLLCVSALAALSL
jgi:hypothetical protein